MLEELKKIGLSDNEAKVYLALLELGGATAQQIAQKSGVNRPTTYVQLENLMKDGLVSSYEKGPLRKGGAFKTYFKLENPKYLENLINKEQNLILNKEKTLKIILPNLEKLFVSERPLVRFFAGVEGIRTMQNEYLNELNFLKNKEILGITSVDAVLGFFPLHIQEYTAKRVKLGIKSRLIYTSSKGSFLSSSDKKFLRESRYIKLDKFPQKNDITIYGENVAFTVFDETPLGVIVKSNAIADSMRAFFELSWHSLS